MEDPTAWHDPSQSFGYNMPQLTMTSKNPFTTGAQVSPTKSNSYRLRWHNSVAEDYSPGIESGYPLKRSASMAMPETQFDYPDQFLLENRATTPTKTIPQTKKRKPSSASSSISTPVKLKQVYEGTFDPVSAPPGIQTPPPSNPTVKRRRGRPPKNQPSAGTSQLEFVNEQTTNIGSLSDDTTPTRTVQSGTYSSPVLQQTDSFLSFSNHDFQGPTLDIVGDMDFNANKYWDASFAGSVMAGDIDIVAATATFDWSMLPTTMGVMDPSRQLSIHDSFLHDSINADALNFSFAQDHLSTSDLISPVSVDPNLIFSGQNLAGNYDDNFGDAQPYRQQNLQRQQEKDHAQQKRKEKSTSTKLKPPTGAKGAATAASSRPVIKRALTESALSKSAGRSNASNATVRPSLVQQMGSFPGKRRPLVRDENTTPSPTIGSSSVPQVSPQNIATKRSAKVKTAVSFSISPGGRAKAEKVIIREPNSTARSDSEEDREDYDGDSSTDEDDFGPMQSRYSINAQRSASSKSNHHRSSSFSRSMERPKLARFKTAPESSFSSSSRFLMSGDFTSDSFSLDNNPFLPHNMSMSSFHGEPRRKSGHNRHHSRSSSFQSVKSAVAPSRTTNLGSMREEDEYSEAETVVDEPTYKSPGDAILALKQAVARRQSSNPTGGTSRRPPSSYGTSRPSTRHTNFLPSSPPMQSQSYGFSTPQTVRSGYSTDPLATISPTTVTDPDVVTPSTYGSRPFGSRHDDMAIDMRCRCSSTGSPEMPVLQCNACFKWLHVQCEGYGHKPIPPSIVCSFCKGGWQGPQPSQRVFRKPSLPQNIIPQDISPVTTQSFQS